MNAIDIVEAIFDWINCHGCIFSVGLLEVGSERSLQPMLSNGGIMIEINDRYVSLIQATKAILSAPLNLSIEDQKRVVRILAGLPAADVRENVRGEWGECDGYDECYGYSYPCSVCGRIEIGKTNFCSNCGADMRGEQDA